ncbi:MAG TPA: hypothetical protein DCS48_09940 [Desulfovibrio sp.]|nr:hypothetical protein [Desulfovibrio sp.]
MLNVDILDKLRTSLPPVFGRRYVEEITGGLIKMHTLANWDALGEGPETFKLANKVGYEKESFLKWLEPRIKQVREKDM